MEFPSPLDFLSILGVEPIETVPTDGYWLYQLTVYDVTCTLSFNIIEHWIQVELFSHDSKYLSFYQEGAIYLRIHAETSKTYISSKFLLGNSYSNVIIDIAPKIFITINTIRR